MEEKIAIIILNYNHAEETIQLYKILKTNLGEQYYYFVIDNNSHDADRLDEYALQNNIKKINEDDYASYESTTEDNSTLLIRLFQNYGYAKGNNYGIKLAYKLRFKYAFVLNPDVTIPDFRVFSVILEILDKNRQKVAIAGPKILFSNGVHHGPFKRKDLSFALRNFFFPLSYLIIKIWKRIELVSNGYNKVYSVVGCFFALNLKLCAEVGFFDEGTFLYWEELILSEKLKRGNKSVIYIPDLKVVHNQLYDSAFLNNPFFIESRNYYEQKFLKLNNLTKKLLDISNKYYAITWNKLKTVLK